MGQTVESRVLPEVNGMGTLSSWFGGMAGSSITQRLDGTVEGIGIQRGLTEAA